MVEIVERVAATLSRIFIDVGSSCVEEVDFVSESNATASHRCCAAGSVTPTHECKGLVWML